MLKLAEWYQTHLTTKQGEEKCEKPEKGKCPPASKQTDSLSIARTALGEITSQNPTTNDKTIEPDCKTAPPAAAGGKGGA